MIDLIPSYVAAEFTLGTGRTVPTVAAVVGLVGVVFGTLAVIRPLLFRVGGPISIILGLISIFVGGLHAAYAAGGVGTGNGIAGAIVAAVLGLLGIALGTLAFFRSRRTA